MQRTDGHSPDRLCGIVTQGPCDQFVNTTFNMECFLRNNGSIGDLQPIPTCEATAWSGCYKKLGKLKLDIGWAYVALNKITS